VRARKALAAGTGHRQSPPVPSDAIQCKPLEVVVSDRGIERAIKMLKRKLASEGVLRELKVRRHYLKPSIKRRKKQAEAARRRRKRARMDAAPPKGAPT
jgi:small subunit ribosomal protein S21